MKRLGIMKRLGENLLILMVGLFLIQPGYSQLEKNSYLV
jgi:hypothetical protein